MQIRTLVLREAMDVRAVRIVPCSFTTRATLAPWWPGRSVACGYD